MIELDAKIPRLDFILEFLGTIPRNGARAIDLMEDFALTRSGLTQRIKTAKHRGYQIGIRVDDRGYEIIRVANWDAVQRRYAAYAKRRDQAGQ